MRKLLLISLLAVAVAGAGLFYVSRSHQVPIVTPKIPADSQPDEPLAPARSTFNKYKLSTIESSSLWVIASRSKPLVQGYTPVNLRAPNVSLRLAATDEQMQVRDEAATALEQLFEGAERNDVPLMLSSAYRSEALQTQFYNNYVARDGVEKADTYSARAGTSEHQTGLAVDIYPRNGDCRLEVCFGELPEGKWVALNAHTYGFVVRYQLGKETVTGYSYEPWHLRYVGVELATELNRTNQTMKEFFSPQ